MTDSYRIERSPNLASVTPDAVIRYTCIGPRTQGWYGDGSIRDEQSVRWWVYRDRRVEGKDLKFVYGMSAKEGDSPFGWHRTYEWSQDPGDYLVIAEIHKAGAEPQVAVLSQHVMSEEEVKGEIARLVTKARQDGLSNPDEADAQVEDQLLALDAIATNGPPMSPTQRDQHKKTVERWTSYRKKLAERLAPTQGRRRVPILAVHLDFATQQRRQLNFFLVEMPETKTSDGELRHTWRLVDWTNPEVRAESSESEGQGESDKEGIADTFSDWDWWRGRYPPGRIRFEIPRAACLEEMSFEYETDGATTWDTVVGALSVTAMVAGVVVIGVATLGTAIPAGVAAAAGTTALIVSTASGVGAEVISISVRRAEGIHDTKADAVNVLGIVASLFQLRWLKGAKVVTAGKAGTFRFLGTVVEGSVNLAQGVLILDEQFEATQRELEHLRKDPDLLPEERARQISMLFMRLAATGALTYVSLRADATQISELAKKRGIPASKTKLGLADLKDEGKTIELGAAKATEGTVEKGKGKTVVDTREPVPKLPRPKIENPIKVTPAGLRGREHNAFKRLSKDRIIFVRDSNPARTRKYPFKVTSKPESCKFKTLKAGDYEGLAAAGPNDPVVKEILSANGWDFYRDQAKFRAYLDDHGFTLGSEAEQYIVRNKRTGEAFTGDIDIHGIYDLNNGRRVELTPKLQNKLNMEAEGKVVMHGAHDDWPEHLAKTIDGKANVNYGPQPPVTAYVDGEAVQLNSWREMKDFGTKYGINVEAEYPGIDWDYWREMRIKSGKGTE